MDLSVNSCLLGLAGIGLGTIPMVLKLAATRRGYQQKLDAQADLIRSLSAHIPQDEAEVGVVSENGK